MHDESIGEEGGNCLKFSPCVKMIEEGDEQDLGQSLLGWQPLPSLCPVSTGNALLNLLITAGPDKASAGDGKGGEAAGQFGGKSERMTTTDTVPKVISERKRTVERDAVSYLLYSSPIWKVNYKYTQ